jgi:hypothetical protein
MSLTPFAKAMNESKVEYFDNFDEYSDNECEELDDIEIRSNRESKVDDEKDSDEECNSILLQKLQNLRMKYYRYDTDNTVIGSMLWRNVVRADPTASVVHDVVREYAEEVISTVEAESDYMEEYWVMMRFFETAMSHRKTPVAVAIDCVKACAALYSTNYPYDDDNYEERWMMVAIQSAATRLSGDDAHTDDVAQSLELITEAASAGDIYEDFIYRNICSHDILIPALATAVSNNSIKPQTPETIALSDQLLQTQALFAQYIPDQIG